MKQDKPWFVRHGSGWTSSVRPASAMGWLIAAAYSVTIILLVIWVDRFKDYLAVWFVVVLALSLLFVTAAIRLSVPAERSDGTGDS